MKSMWMPSDDQLIEIARLAPRMNRWIERYFLTGKLPRTGQDNYFLTFIFSNNFVEAIKRVTPADRPLIAGFESMRPRTVGAADSR